MINNSSDKKILSQLIVDFSPSMKSVEVMDEFDEYSNKLYSQLVIKKCFLYSGNPVIWIDIIIERNKYGTEGYERLEGDGNTFTELKQKEAYSILSEVYKITSSQAQEYIFNTEIFYFKKPVLFKAQKSDNRKGFGKIANWKGDGILYGDTTAYKIIGVYINSL